MATTTPSDPAAVAGTKLWTLPRALLNFILSAFRWAVNIIFFGTSRTDSTQPAPHPEAKLGTRKMAESNSTAKRSAVRIAPALPLYPGHTGKEGEPHPTGLEPKTNPDTSRDEVEAQAVTAISRLDLKPPTSNGPSKTLSIPIEGLTGERAIHAAFMREALDMVCTLPSLAKATTTSDRS